MMINRLYIFVISLVAMMLIFSASIASAQGNISVDISLDRDTIGLDENAVMQIVVSGESQNLPDPQVPTFAAFEVYSQGRSSNISIVNGQVSSSVTYRYILMPKKPGTFPIDNIAVIYKNKRYKGNKVELTVLNSGTATSPKLEDRALGKSGKGKDYFMEAVVDNKNPFVNEQVTLTLKFYIAVQYYGTPELAEPTTTGFWNEIIGNKAPYRQRIGDRVYRVIERKYALFPTQTGELTIGRATIRTTVASRSRRRRDPFGMFNDFFNTGKEITVRSSPIKIKVKPLPEKGRPDDFTGSIGRFKISATVDKREVEVNQPVTVTIKISGTGNIKSAAEPHIPESDNFRIYRASSNENITKIKEKIGGTKVYEEVFIPKRPGELEIPALTYNYFDPKKEKYKTLTTRPITLHVTLPEGYTASTDVPYSQSEFLVGSSARDIRYIRENMGPLSPQGQIIFTRPLYLVVNGLPVLALIGMVLLRKRREKLNADIGYARSRQAGKRARKRLAKARSLAAVDKAEAYFAEVHLALTSYIADKLNISPYGLTTDKVKELLEKHSADQELIDSIIDVLHRCDFARFAPATVTQEDIDQLLKTVENIMVRLEGIKFV